MPDCTSKQLEFESFDRRRAQVNFEGGTKPGGPNATWKEAPWIHGAVRNHIDLDPEYPLLPHSKDSKRALLAKAILTKQGIKRVRFCP